MNIREYSLDELKLKLQELDEKPFRAIQIYEWLHKHMICSLDEASNLSKELKLKLNESFDVSFPRIEKEYVSKIDETKKYLIRLTDDYIIESVLMKYKYGYTVCVSSEVGCNMGCKFCASTVNGMKRNLHAHEILAQIYLIAKHNNIKISNIVIMGMGEPLLNLDNVIRFLNIINDENGQKISLRNITLSTCGIVENIYKLASYNLPITLALSLHAPNDEIRKRLMPIANKYKLNDVMDAMAQYFEKTNRKITCEYTLIDGINSNICDAKELKQLFDKYFTKKHIDYNVNLIAVNEINETSFKAPSRAKVLAFRDYLLNCGVQVMIRRELGKDISGSCGQLRMSVK